MDVLIIMALILVPVTALLSFLGYKFISYYEIVSEPPSVIKWTIGTIAVYIALMMVQLLRLLLSDYWNEIGGRVGQYLLAFILFALMLFPIFAIGSYFAYKYPGFGEPSGDPPPIKTWIIITLVIYFIFMAMGFYTIVRPRSSTYVYVIVE